MSDSIPVRLEIAGRQSDILFLSQDEVLQLVSKVKEILSYSVPFPITVGKTTFHRAVRTMVNDGFLTEEEANTFLDGVLNFHSIPEEEKESRATGPREKMQGALILVGKSGRQYRATPWALAEDRYTDQEKAEILEAVRRDPETKRKWEALVELGRARGFFQDTKTVQRVIYTPKEVDLSGLV